MTVIAFDKNDTTKVMFKGQYNNIEEAKEIYDMYDNDCLIKISNSGFENILK